MKLNIRVNYKNISMFYAFFILNPNVFHFKPQNDSLLPYTKENGRRRGHIKIWM